jgi:hypothetical protein
VKKEDARLDQLLSRGSLGGPQYDEIFERVMERSGATAPARRRFWRWSWVAAVALAPAVVLLLVHRSGDQALRSKGPPGQAIAAVDISCGPSAARACRAGDVLMFTVNAAVASGYLGAFAERLDDPTHERIWYFSEATTGPPLVRPGAGTVVVPRGIRIGPEHRPGRYRVTAWIASQPLDRGQIDVAAPDVIRSRSTLDFEVVP